MKKPIHKRFLIIFIACVIFLCGCVVGGLVFSAKKPTAYTVTFDSQGGTLITQQIVVKGDKAIEPPIPTKNCKCEFVGWYLGEEKWSFVGYAVTEDITLTAKWINCFGLNDKETEILKEFVCEWFDWADIVDIQRSEIVDANCWRYKITFKSGWIETYDIQKDLVCVDEEKNH